MVLPEPKLRLHQLLWLAHQARKNLDERAVYLRAAIKAQCRPVKVLLTGQEVVDQLTAALGDIAEDRPHLVRRRRSYIRF